MEKLKACPFCGGKAVFERFNNPKNWYAVRCTVCGCQTDGFRINHDDATDAQNKSANAAVWNRRAAPENKIEGECTMDKKSEEIFNKLYDLHDRYDEDPKHMICAEAADHIKKLSEELEKFKATSENKPLTAQWISAKDKLPEIGQRVVVKCNALYYGMSDVLCYYPDYKPWKNGGVAYWLPLPELPENARKPEGSKKS